VAKHDSSTIIKSADDTTVVGLITDNDETACRKEVRDLAAWFQDNNLSLNVIKTKELIMNYNPDDAGHLVDMGRGRGWSTRVSGHAIWLCSRLE
jgi:hypothetical protein